MAGISHAVSYISFANIHFPKEKRMKILTKATNSSEFAVRYPDHCLLEFDAGSVRKLARIASFVQSTRWKNSPIGAPADLVQLQLAHLGIEATWPMYVGSDILGDQEIQHLSTGLEHISPADRGLSQICTASLKNEMALVFADSMQVVCQDAISDIKLQTERIFFRDIPPMEHLSTQIRRIA